MQAPQGGFLIDLSELNLLGWVSLVQDVVGVLMAVPHRLGQDVASEVVVILRLLQAATGVGFCCHCFHLRLHCICAGASQLTPPTLWSQMVKQTPGYGQTSSSGGVPQPSTSTGGMPGHMAPPPGLTPIDFSIWSLPPQEVPSPPGLLAFPQYQPPVGRAFMMRAAIDKKAQTLWMPGSQASTSQALVLWAPQMVPPLCQLAASSRNQPATPYQQAVQPPSQTTGLKVTFYSFTDKTAATGDQDVDGCGRQRTQS